MIIYKSFLKKIWVRAIALTFLLIFFGCGSDKYSTPISDIEYVGPRPKNLKVDVNPSKTYIQYFKFKISMSDPNQSVLDKDHWTIEGCRGYFTIDTNENPFLAPFVNIDERTPYPVATTYPTAYPVTLLTKEWIERSCEQLKGSHKVIPVSVHLQFYAHRNKDKFRVVIPVDFSFTIGDF